jgi:hypothetical protein
MRPLLLMWAAAPAAAAMAYTSAFGAGDNFFTITHWMGEPQPHGGHRRLSPQHAACLRGSWPNRCFVCTPAKPLTCKRWMA